MQGTITFIPLLEKNGPCADYLMKYVCSHAEQYFPITVVCEDEAAFSDKKTYVVGEFAWRHQLALAKGLHASDAAATAVAATAAGLLCTHHLMQ